MKTHRIVTAFVERPEAEVKMALNARMDLAGLLIDVNAPDARLRMRQGAVSVIPAMGGCIVASSSAGVAWQQLIAVVSLVPGPASDLAA